MISYPVFLSDAEPLLVILRLLARKSPDSYGGVSIPAYAIKADALWDL